MLRRRRDESHVRRASPSYAGGITRIKPGSLPAPGAGRGDPPGRAYFAASGLTLPITVTPALPSLRTGATTTTSPDCGYTPVMAVTIT